MCAIDNRSLAALKRRPLIRGTLAVLAAAALGATTFAGRANSAVVEGSLTFPSAFIPAMTVYARDVDSSKLHSVSTNESQASFKIDLPAGRYVFFAEPRQAGAPDIYGAFTQAAVCKARIATDPCEDHSLIVYTVGAKSAAPMISDWMIPDELADEFDQLLGNRPETSPQELGAPHFSEYPVAGGGVAAGAAGAGLPAAGQPAAPPILDFSGSSLSADKQERIQETVKAGPNFAGNMVIAQLPCGANCVDPIVVDLRTGKVQSPPALGQIIQDLPCRGDESILFRRNSRLLSVTRRRDAGITTQYFIWKPENSTFIQTAEYQRAPERFCTPP
jgi:hypothetical protein